MFCRNCGAQNKDGAAFCQSCGAPLNGEEAGSAVSSIPRPVKGNNILLLGGAAAAVVIVIIVALVMLLGGRSEKNVVKGLINGITKGNAKSIVSLIPDKVIDEVCDEQDMTKKELTNELDDMLDDMLEMINDEYDKWSITYKILDTDDYSKKELRNLSETYEDEFDIKVKDAKELTVKLTVKADGDTDSNTIKVPVIKVGKSWYLDFSNFNMYSVFY